VPLEKKVDKTVLHHSALITENYTEQLNIYTWLIYRTFYLSFV